MVSTNWKSCDANKTTSGKANQAVVECCNCFKVEMIGGFVEDEDVGPAEHHARQHAAHALTAGKHVRFFNASSPEKSIRPRKPRRNVSLVSAEYCPSHSIKFRSLRKTHCSPWENKPALSSFPSETHRSQVQFHPSEFQTTSSLPGHWGLKRNFVTLIHHQ